MKFLKRALPIVLAVCLLASLGAVSAIDAGETRTVIGADLTDDQIKTVYKTFGIERGSVKELTVTNKDERQYLSGVISDEQIGTKSISCISIEVLDAGKGMTVDTSHITYCTSQMYISALATAGITDAKITVTAPFDVSGTAALTGVYKAYEDITGTKLDETAKAVKTSTYFSVKNSLSDLYADDEVMNEYQKLMPYLGDYYQVTPGWAEARTAWWNMLQQVGEGADVTTAVTEFCTTANAAAAG